MHQFSWAKAALLLPALLAPVAHAAGTAAGTDITNTATASFTGPSGAQTINSNAVVLRVDEVLDVTISPNDAGYVSVASPEADRALSFTVTNTGNGAESFALSFNGALGADQFNPSNIRIFLDNGDGVFDALSDTLYVAGSNEPVLAADSSRIVFVVSDVPGALADGDLGLVSLSAEAVTAQATAGTDAPGMTFVGAGANGTDAVVGASQALASAQNGYMVGQALATLTKTQAVVDPFGGANAIPGATITYTLVFNAGGTGSLTGAQVVDAIPANTTYVPGSLTLDAAPLTDVVDGDGGRFTSTQIEVVLGDLVAPATHTVTFQVLIN